MKTYSIKANNGRIFENKFRTKDTHPEFLGDLYLDKELITELLNNSKENLVKIRIGLYHKQNDKGSYMSLYASKPFQKTDNQPDSPGADDDLPF